MVHMRSKSQTQLDAGYGPAPVVWARATRKAADRFVDETKARSSEFGQAGISRQDRGSSARWGWAVLQIAPSHLPSSGSFSKFDDPQIPAESLSFFAARACTERAGPAAATFHLCQFVIGISSIGA